METNKFEKYMGERLKEREIVPSPDAWDRVSQQLAASRTPRKKRYFWFAMAASCAGIAILSILFLKYGPYQSNEGVKIVDSPGTVGENPAREPLPTMDLSTGSAFEGNRSDMEKNADSDGPAPKRAKLNDRPGSKTTVIQYNVEEALTKMVYTDTDDLIEAKIVEVMAKATLMESDSTALSDAEVDSLLYNAQRELLANRVFKGNRSVDAMALLNEVETELDQTFRSQIFDALKEGFLRARTAVADRNN